MFDVVGIAWMNLKILEHDIKVEKQFRDSIKDLPIEEQLSRINSWESAKEKARLEAIEERRHQELCRAIRESGRPLWPLYFGGL